MRYVVIGAGGTGGMLGAYLAGGGMDVTLIARGAHLKAMQEKGLALEKIWDGSRTYIPVKACTMEEYEEKPDVVFVCVKGYSLDSVVPFIDRISHPDTIVIPILNIYGTGGRLQEKLPGILVTDGCIYVSANIKEPGVLVMHGQILRVVFGVRKKEEYRPALEKIREDLSKCHIEAVLSSNIQKDALKKFSYVSPMGAAGLCCNGKAGDFQKEGRPREMFIAMIREITALAAAMGIHYEEDLVQTNLKILSDLNPEATTSMQRDILEGKQSEADGLVGEVIRLGKKYQVPTPVYEKAARIIREKYGVQMI